MSCSDVQTIKAGDGSTLTFSFDFPYIFKSEIHVYFWNATTKEYDEILEDGLLSDDTYWNGGSTAYPWSVTDANPTIVTFTTAPPAPAAAVDPGESVVDNIKIRRITNVDDIRALFNPGSAIRSEDLNKNFEQLRYAIQESNCQGIPDDVDEYLKNYYWDRFDNTVYEGDAWNSSDSKIASTAAIEKEIDRVIANDITTNGTGITISTGDGGNGTIELGLGENSIDFDKIKDEDIIDQSAYLTGTATDNNIYTAAAINARYDNTVTTAEPSGTTHHTGRLHFRNDDDKTLSMWNGSIWEPITSGGTFARLEKVIYVDSINGNDDNNGHRISSPKKTIKAAINDINADSVHGDGSVVLVSPGVYQEVAPIDIQRRDVAIIGASVRNVIVHPTPNTQDQEGEDGLGANTDGALFRVNSGTYLSNMTFTGMKAGGTRGESGSLWEDSTYGLPANQGWNVSFYPNAMIYKSPYIQNCTNFSDSGIDNDDTVFDFYEGTEEKGRAGDLTSDMTGGGLLVNGDTPHVDSPLRSMVCDSYTHTGLDAPGIFVTNNGYCQATSSYAFFNHFHIACLNGGQANLAASTSDFGRFSMIADGRSTTAIFTATTTAAASEGDLTFTIDAPTADASWHGSENRPQDNMLVDIGGNTYPVLSAVANGTGWDVTISRPNTNDRTENLGLAGAVSSGAAVSFYLRSMIASSGHTMEYVGSGTDYRALPENGGVPDDTKQLTELNNGKIWAATTDHQGTFKVGETFSVNQQTGFVDIAPGALSLGVLLTDLNTNSKKIISGTGTNNNIVIDPDGTGTVDVSSAKITSVADPTDSSDAANKNYVDGFIQTDGSATVTTNDTSFFTTSASDTRYFRQDSSETITSGVTWSGDDAHVATTSAIDNRIVDLLDDIGGFVPITNETSFPATNPDTDNGAGTIVSVKELSTSYSHINNVVTITDGAGTGNDVTINSCPDLPAGFGVLVETTTTLHTYTFHRIVPKATEVTTVAGISANVTTVAGISADVTTVAGISANVTTVANDGTDIGTVATNIANVNTVAGIDSNVTTVAGISANVTSVANDATDIGTVATNIADVNTVAGISTDVTTVANDQTDIGTVATNIADVSTVAGISANVTTVANDGTDIGTVATNIANVNTVAGIDANVTTVAGISTDVTAVANDATDIGTVAGKATEIGRLGTADAVADMNTLGTADVVSDMNTLATTANVNNMSTCATDISNVNTVAGSISNVNTTANSITSVNTVATNIANVNLTGGSITNVNTTAGSITNVNTVATNISDVNTVAADQTDIGTVAGISSDVTTVAGISANVTTVANNDTNVTTVAGKATEIGRLGTADAVADMAILGTTDVVADMAILGTTDVVADMAILGTTDVVADMAILATTDVVADMNTLGTADVVADMNTLATAANVTNMDTCATDISNINTVATNITDVNTFSNRYRISATAPSTSLDDGDLWWDTTNDVLKIYDATGSAWVESTQIATIPQNSQTSAYTLASTDVGKHVNITTGGVTIPYSSGGAFSIGDAISIFNDSSSDQSITPATNVTLYSAGTSGTGTRTLAQRGLCTVLCVGTNEYVIAGAGLS